MKVLSIVALVLFVSTQSFANSAAKPAAAAPAAASSEVAAPAAPAAGEPAAADKAPHKAKKAKHK